MSLMLKQEARVLQGACWKEFVQAAEAQLIKPAFAVQSEPDRYILKAYVPGGHDLAVRVEGDTLTLQGVSRQRFIGGRTFGYVRERPLKATFTLPPDASDTGVTTEARSGLLLVRVPRTPCLTVEAVTESSTSPMQKPAPSRNP